MVDAIVDHCAYIACGYCIVTRLSVDNIVVYIREAGCIRCRPTDAFETDYFKVQISVPLLCIVL